MSDSQGHRLALDYIERWSSDLVELVDGTGCSTSNTPSLLLWSSLSLLWRSSSRLARQGWSFYLPPEVDEDELQGTVEGPALGELAVEMVPSRFGPQIYRNLKLLAGNANGGFLDTGIWTLFLGLGQLCWTDVEGIDAISLNRPGFHRDSLVWESAISAGVF